MIVLRKKNSVIDSVGVLGGITTCVSDVTVGVVDAVPFVEVVAVKESAGVERGALTAVVFCGVGDGGVVFFVGIVTGATIGGVAGVVNAAGGVVCVAEVVAAGVTV